ncbi:excinuclease [Acinetobacter pittii]|uniref:excinuclease n=1 Tax=Acinetobacter pittii TaxID=48296 RepID=UPI002A04C051|nr:excinuclease [Acinetobacter pittii]MDX8254530.1 excinuclease [Acinetobacter pittii]
MLNKKLLFVAMLSAGFTATVQAKDELHQLNFKEAVDRAVSDGTLDGSVKFYLKGTKSGGKVIQKDAVTNKKTNGFAQSAASSCDWVLRSALIQMQNNAKSQGANAVTNIVSYFKANETTSTTTYDCYKGAMMAGVALKGDVVKF